MLRNRWIDTNTKKTQIKFLINVQITNCKIYLIVLHPQTLLIPKLTKEDNNSVGDLFKDRELSMM